MTCFSGHLFQGVLQNLDALALAADDDTGFCRVEGGLDAVARALDLDARDGRLRQGAGASFSSPFLTHFLKLVLLDGATNLIVLIQSGGELPFRQIPGAVRVADDADPKSDRMYFLSQLVFLSSRVCDYFVSAVSVVSVGPPSVSAAHRCLSLRRAAPGPSLPESSPRRERPGSSLSCGHDGLRLFRYGSGCRGLLRRRLPWRSFAVREATAFLGFLGLGSTPLAR